MPDEIVLDYIVERKREDDLLASIPDGRFIEQKVLACKLSYLLVSSSVVWNQKSNLFGGKVGLCGFWKYWKGKV